VLCKNLEHLHSTR